MMCYSTGCANHHQALAPTAGRCPQCGERTAFAIGTVVTNGPATYEIEDVLGIGGMGKVYRARDGTGNVAAVKELFCDDPAELAEAQRRFRREADIQAQIRSPHFPRGFGHFQDHGREFMAMEFVPGRDLEKELQQNWMPGGMNDVVTLELGIQICEALSVLHNFRDAAGNLDPIVHRDIKPGNIVLKPTGEICILDLGIARVERQTPGTRARQTSVGTYEYMALEQLMGNPVPRSDLYSTAATLFHLRTGEAFKGDQVDRLAEIDGLPIVWQATFRQALAVDEGNRHRNVEEFRQALIVLLPPAQQAAYAAPAPGAPVAPPAPAPVVTPPVITMVWRNTQSNMHGPNEYRRPVAGRLLQNGTGLGGINVIPQILDHGAGPGTGNRGTRVTTQPHGDFSLAIPDITVPVAVTRREIELSFEDLNGVEIHRTTVQIDRPWLPQRAAANVAAGGGVIAHGVARPARAFGHGIARGANGLGRGLRWPFRQMARGGRAARQGVAAFAAAATSWQLLIGIAVLLLAATFVGAALQKRWDWLIWIWPHCLIGAIAFAYFGWKLRTRNFGQVLKRAFAVNFLVILWVMGWLGYILR